MRRGQHAVALRVDILLIRRDLYRRLCPSPHPLSEQKVFRGFIIDIVDEKNQKNEKLLIEKKGRFFQKAHSDAC
jgi:hypothetical protein